MMFNVAATLQPIVSRRLMPLSAAAFSLELRITLSFKGVPIGERVVPIGRDYHPLEVRKSVLDSCQSLAEGLCVEIRNALSDASGNIVSQLLGNEPVGTRS